METAKADTGSIVAPDVSPRCKQSLPTRCSGLAGFTSTLTEKENLMKKRTLALLLALFLLGAPTTQADDGIITIGRTDGVIYTERTDGIISTVSADGIMHTGRTDGVLWTERTDGVIWPWFTDGTIWTWFTNGIIHTL